MKKPDIRNMTLREKIAQTMIVKQSDLLLRSDKAYSELREPEETVALLKNNQYGGFWTHGNLEINGMCDKYDGYWQFTTKKYRNWLEEATVDMKIPPLCACDPSGKSRCLDLSNYITGLIVGATDSEEYAYELGRCMGLEHRTTGGNWLWGPAIDLSDRLGSGVVRHFSHDRDQLIRLASAYIAGMQSVGVAATAKHFPGADPKETRDSHVVTTLFRTPLEEWRKEQGAVFQALIDAGVYSVMTGAKMCPQWDDTMYEGKYLPAGLSKKIIMDVLKGEMGFKGVVVTDSTNMGGFTRFYPNEERYARFLEAGNDMLLAARIDGLDEIEACVHKGIVTEERIDDACRRILDMKEKLGLFDEDYKEQVYNIEDVAPLTEANAKNIARDGITLVRDRIGLLPMKQKPRHVTIFTYTHRENIMTRLQAMKNAFEQRGATVTLRRRPNSFGDIHEAVEQSDLIIYAGYIWFHAPKGAPSFYDDEFWALRYAFTEGKEKSMGISLGYPFIHYKFMDDADVFVNLYTPDERAQEAFVAAVYGENPFKGVPPLDMEV